MAILVSNAAANSITNGTSTNTFTLGSTDATNTIVGVTTASETFTFSGTGKVSVLDVSTGDKIILSSLASTGIKAKVNGNVVTLTNADGITEKLVLGALAGGESVTVQFSGSELITIAASNVATPVYSVTSGSVVTTLGATPLLVIDSTPPSATTTLVVTDDVGAVSGALTTGGFTDDTSLALSGTITGTLDAGEVIAVYNGTTRLGVATVSGSTWTYTDSTLANGNNVSYTARAEDAAGNQGTATTAFTATIDTTAPTASVVTVTMPNSGNASVTSSEGTGKAYLVKSTIAVTNLVSITSASVTEWNEVVISSTNATTLAATGLVDGTYKVYTVDAAGNLSTASANTVTIDSNITPDIVPPAAPTITQASATNGVFEVTVDNTADVASTKLFNAANTEITNQFTVTTAGQVATFTPKANTVEYAANNFTAKAVDAAANVSVASSALAYTYDNKAPTVSVVTATIPNTGNAVVTSSEATGTAYLVKTTLTQPTTSAELVTLNTNSDTSVNTVAISSTNATNLIATGLGDGTYKVYTVDGSGNLSAVSTNTVTIDSTAPAYNGTNAAITLSDTALKIGEAATVTFVFPEAVTGFSNADVTLGTGTMTNVASTDGGITWTAIFTPTADSQSATNAISVNMTTLTDIATNAGIGTLSSANYTIDTLAPTNAVISTVASNDSVNATEATAGFTITGTGDVGASVALTFTSGRTLTSGNTTTVNGSGIWSVAVATADVTAFGEGSETISVIQTDVAGNPQTTTTTKVITVDTVAPTSVPTGIAETTTTNLTDSFLNAAEAAGNTTIQVTLPAAATGDSVELLLGGASFSTPKITSLNAGDTTTSFSVSQADLGTDAAKSLTAIIIDSAGNKGSANTTPFTFTLDTTAPTAPTTVTVTPVGGNVVANTLNNTNTNLTASAAITAGQTGGKAELKVGSSLIATDSSIVSGDSSVTFDLGKTSTTALQAAISVGNVVTVTLFDAAGNATVSTASNPTLTVDYSPTTLTASGLALSADTGVAGDFITNTAAQTITATLSGALTNGEVVHGSVDNGVTWTIANITVNGSNVITWTGATLSNTSSVKFKIVDAQGNESVVATHTYEVDTTAPAAPTFTLTDTGSSNTDGISKDGTITVAGFETGATWQYWDLSLSTPAWSSAQNISTTTFALPAGTYAIGTIQVKQTDIAGNATTTPATNAAQIVIDTAAPTAQTVAIDQAFKGDGATTFATGLTLGTSERFWLAPSATTTFTANATTITSSTTAAIVTPTTEGTYNLFYEDAAGNFSAASTNAITVDNTAPTSTISGVTFIQKFGADANVIRLAGTNFNTILTGTENSSTDIKTRLDLTKLIWNVDSSTTQALAVADIDKISVVSATQLDIVLKTSNALYSNVKFLTTDSVADTVVVNAGFIKDQAGNVATLDAMTSLAATVSDTYNMTLVEVGTGTPVINNPTIFVPKVELVAPASGNATFSGANLKITPTTSLKLTDVHNGQTITLQDLTKMNNIGNTNTITFASASGATTGQVVIDLTGVSGVDLSNADGTSAAITLTGGSSTITLGTGTYSIALTTTTLTPANSNMFNVLDTVSSFHNTTDHVNFKVSTDFSALGSTTGQIAAGNIYFGDTPASAAGKNIWIMTDGTIAYDNDGSWGIYDGAGAFDTSGTNGNSVALISIPDVTANNLYLVA